MSDELREQPEPEAPPRTEPAATAPAPDATSALPPDEPELRRPRRPPGPPADGVAVAAFVLAILGVQLVAVVLGHLALARIRQGTRGGRGLAVAALGIGYAGLVLTLALAVLYFAVLAPLVTLPG